MKTIALALLFVFSACAPADDGEDLFDATGTWTIHTTWQVGNCGVPAGAVGNAYTFEVSHVVVQQADTQIDVYGFMDTRTNEESFGDLDCSDSGCSGYFVIIAASSVSMTLTFNVTVDQRHVITGTGQYTLENISTPSHSCQQDFTIDGTLGR
jgi:hypothetical protein